jgi:hypothetical protein
LLFDIHLSATIGTTLCKYTSKHIIDYFNTKMTSNKKVIIIELLTFTFILSPPMLT